MSAQLVKVFLPILLTISMHAKGMTMEQNTEFAIASAGACKNYALEVGGDTEAFSNMFMVGLKVAEKLGYTNDTQSFLAKIDYIKKAIEKHLAKKYNSKVDAYNDWCIRFYKGFQKGYRRGMK